MIIMIMIIVIVGPLVMFTVAAQGISSPPAKRTYAVPYRLPQG